MTVAEARANSGVDRRDADVLLSALLERTPAWLLAHAHQVLSSAESQEWQAWCERRRGGEPVAYITEQQEFYGRPFRVTPVVLIPRPATEGLVDAVKRFLLSPDNSVAQIDAGIVAWSVTLRDLCPTTLVDCGTGSGCIAVTLALECPDKTIIATDISDAALMIAKQNAQTLGVGDRIEFREGSLLDPVQDLTEPFLLVSNPPYVPTSEKLMTDVVDFEPHLALFGGKDGADILRSLVRQAKAHPQCCGFVVECRDDQASI